MVQATKFLLRWLYLNNLIRDRAEIQLLPHIQPHHQHATSTAATNANADPPYSDPTNSHWHDQNPSQSGHYNDAAVHRHHHANGNQQHQHHNGQSHHMHSHQDQSHPHGPQTQHVHRTPPPPRPSHHHHHYNKEEEWKRKALHAIALYPPGSARLLALDSLRLEIVHEFARDLKHADIILQKEQQNKARRRRAMLMMMMSNKQQDDDEKLLDDVNDDVKSLDIVTATTKGTKDTDLSDREIIKAFQKATSSKILMDNNDIEKEEDDDSVDVETNPLYKSILSEQQQQPPQQQQQQPLQHHNNHDVEKNIQLDSALALQKEIREYLPQLVSAILHSPPPLTTQSQQPAQHQQHLQTMGQSHPTMAYPTTQSTTTTATTSTVDPLAALRRLLLTRCVQDPNLGIELCWLLEAEVGRAWKKLFEHRQQTGRRLIVVLPAEKAAVIAKIGTEKRSAFDLLQDVESATAYGVYGNDQHEQYHQQQQQGQQGHSQEDWVDSYKDGGWTTTEGFDTDTNNNNNNNNNNNKYDLYGTPQLPASLSLKRCSHFGDTMHFIDLLTKLSLDLRLVPIIKRKAFLVDSLMELNRRLRRRMATRGVVSLDVQDNCGPYDWPTLDDVTLETINYSVHLPLEPKTVTWPGSIKRDHNIFQPSDILMGGSSKDGNHNVNCNTPGSSSSTSSNGGAMRVLNIVSDKCRVLASRERCPFLVHCEIAETGLDGSDARLYASGAAEAGGIGVTLEEVLGMTSSPSSHKSKDKNGVSSSRSSNSKKDEFTSYRIPTELLDEEQDSSSVVETVNTNRRTTHQHQPNMYRKNGFNPLYESKTESEQKAIISEEQGVNSNTVTDVLPRGGYQGSDSGFFSPSSSNEYNYSPYDMVREEQLQQLHEQLQSEPHQSSYYGPPPTTVRAAPMSEYETPQLTRYTTLLDRIFGLPWSEVCEQVRQTSPYGKVKGWRLASFIMKAGEDIRREALVMQVISKLQNWFELDIHEHNRPYLRPYSIMCVGGDAGILECVHDAKSIDEVKKETDGFTTLRDYFERAYGPPTAATTTGPERNPMGSLQTGVPISFETAQDNFLRSLVGYSLVCYILQIKDRHNANILLDREGHLMHIDFGFVLGDTPKMGKVPLFSERAPFKLTTEFWEVIGGWNFNQGGLGVRFCKMFEEAFACAAMHADEIGTLIEAGILNLTRNPNEARLLANGVRSRLRMRGPRGSVAQKSFIMDLVNTALTSWGTSTYDWLQKSMNGYI